MRAVACIGFPRRRIRDTRRSRWVSASLDSDVVDLVIVSRMGGSALEHGGRLDWTGFGGVDCRCMLGHDAVLG